MNFTGGGLQNVGRKILNRGAAMTHIEGRHGPDSTSGASKFSPDANINKLLDQAEGVQPYKSGKNYERNIDFGYNVGSDSFAGNSQTTVMTVITRSDGSLVTAHPGYSPIYYAP